MYSLEKRNSESPAAKVLSARPPRRHGPAKSNSAGRALAPERVNDTHANANIDTNIIIRIVMLMLIPNINTNRIASTNTNCNTNTSMGPPQHLAGSPLQGGGWTAATWQ